MNILIPDSWLREFLQTKATPKQIKEYLSLCGPSVERIDKQGKEVVYVIEITSNRPDSMSVAGIAREAAAILPRFGISASLIDDPYRIATPSKFGGSKKLAIKTDPQLNPRFTAIIIDNVAVAQSPSWMQKKLEATGIRPLNNVVDITNWLMRAYGQPAHAFDYDAIKPKNGIPTMILRSSKKGEKIKTLDGKTHSLPGGDIVIEDGAGRLIDLCGIMGAENSSIRETTKAVVLFMQTYDPAHIRRTSMSLAHRTEAASLFEKGVDSELVKPTIIKGVSLMAQLTGGRVASRLYDIYPKPYKPQTVSVSRKKIASYMGVDMTTKEFSSILTPLGFTPKSTASALTVTIPSWRRDVAIDVDVIEEIARIYGYHNIVPTLPDSAPPVTVPDPALHWEREVKIRLRDWGYTELYTYSMISEEQMDVFDLDKKNAYKIINPLSVDWVYMRPKLWPSVLAAVKQNIQLREDMNVFELSMVYEYRKGDLPQERPALLVALVGRRFAQAKGLAEAIFSLFGIPLPEGAAQSTLASHGWNDRIRLLLGDYGSVSEINRDMLTRLGINQPITIVSLYFDELVKNAAPTRIYRPVPSHPPIVEDLAFIVPDKFEIGPFMKTIRMAHPLIADVSLLDRHERTRTFHIVYQDPEKNLTDREITPIRQKLIALAQEKFGAEYKTIS